MGAALQTNIQAGTCACSSHAQGRIYVYAYVVGDAGTDTKMRHAIGRRLLWVALRAAPEPLATMWPVPHQLR